MRKLDWFIFGLAVLIFAGLSVPIDLTALSFPSRDDLPDFTRPGTYLILALLVITLFLPAWPLVCAALRLIFKPAISAWITVPIALIGFIIGIGFLGPIAIFSGPGALYVFGIGGSILLAAAGSLLLLSIKPHREGRYGAVLLGFIPAAIVAAWSLVSGVAVVSSALQISDGDPYCIAGHKPDDPIDSIWDVRGAFFFTTQTGYKMSSRWYFHGVMIVERDDRPEYYNWSPRRLRFDHLENPRLLIGFFELREACMPRARFLETL